MAVDAQTMLLLSLGIAAIAAWYLALEARALGEKSLALWSAGFGAIVIGCSLTPLRAGYSFLVGVWFANGMLVVSHLLFLFGTGHFVGRRPRPAWWALLFPWALLLGLPAGANRTEIFGVLNSGLVAVLALGAAMLLISAGRERQENASLRLGSAFLIHGLWYCLKTGLVFLPGAFIDITRLKGFVIPASLFEGIMVEVVLALFMTAAVRRRRETEIAKAAEIDPLTGVFNRRAFQQRAADLLAEPGTSTRPYALMILDLDGFKLVNDRFGHGFGDRILLAFTETVRALLSHDALFARLGGDEFVLMLPGVDGARAHRLGSAICSNFAERSADFEGSAVPTSVSIGAAVLTGEAPLGDIMYMADTALYEAKRSGRNRLCLRSIGQPPSRGMGDLQAGSSPSHFAPARAKSPARRLG